MALITIKAVKENYKELYDFICEGSNLIFFISDLEKVDLMIREYEHTFYLHRIIKYDFQSDYEKKWRKEHPFENSPLSTEIINSNDLWTNRYSGITYNTAAKLYNDNN